MALSVRLLFVGLIVLLNFGCSTSAVPKVDSLPEELQTEHNKTKAHEDTLASTSNEHLQEVYWKLIGIEGKAVIFSENQREPYLLLKIEDNRMQGFGGCNLLMGTYTLDKQYLKFLRIASTMMACPYLSEEQKLIKVLELSDTYWIDKGVLILGTSKKVPLATFESLPIEP